MFDSLFENLFEVVKTKINPEKKMRDYYKKILNTKLRSSAVRGERGWFKFWLLTNGDVIPIRQSHDSAAMAAGIPSADYLCYGGGAIRGAVSKRILYVDGVKKLTSKQILKLRNICVEYKIDTLTVDLGSQHYSMPVKSPEEAEYYLEYGKEKWESKNKEAKEI